MTRAASPRRVRAASRAAASRYPRRSGHLLGLAGDDPLPAEPGRDAEEAERMEGHPDRDPVRGPADHRGGERDAREAPQPRLPEQGALEQALQPGAHGGSGPVWERYHQPVAAAAARNGSDRISWVNRWRTIRFRLPTVSPRPPPPPRCRPRSSRSSRRLALPASPGASSSPTATSSACSSAVSRRICARCRPIAASASATARSGSSTRSAETSSPPVPRFLPGPAPAVARGARRHLHQLGQSSRCARTSCRSG